MLRSELERFIGEDLGEWDDSSTLIPELTACGIIIAKEDCIISGLAEAVEIFQYFGLKSELLFDDGEFVPAMSTVLEVVGSARKILQSERLVLNFMARMSGISTLTRECVLLAGGCEWQPRARPPQDFDYSRRERSILEAATPIDLIYPMPSS
jgi:Nicotinate-nucleotide pyrophosphorylase